MAGNAREGAWSAPDPARHTEQPEKAREVVREVFQLMQRRISRLVSLPLDRPSLESRARDIAEQTSTTNHMPAT